MKNFEDINYFNLTNFLQNIIKEYYINYKTLDGVVDLLKINDLAIFTYFIAEVDLILLKHYLKYVKCMDLTDDELDELIKNTKLKFSDRFTIIDTTNLSLIEKADIFRNFNELIELDYHGVKFSYNDELYMDYNHVKDFDIAHFSNKYQILYNIKLKQKLLDMGLEEHINMIKSRFLEKEENLAYIRQK